MSFWQRLFAGKSGWTAETASDQPVAGTSGWTHAGPGKMKREERLAEKSEKDELWTALNAAYRRGEWSEAWAAAGQLNRKYPNGQSHLASGCIRLKMKDLPGAMEWFSSAPQDIASHVYLYNIYQCTGDVTNAIAEERILKELGCADDLAYDAKERRQVGVLHYSARPAVPPREPR